MSFLPRAAALAATTALTVVAFAQSSIEKINAYTIKPQTAHPSWGIPANSDGGVQIAQAMNIVAQNRNPTAKLLNTRFARSRTSVEPRGGITPPEPDINWYGDQGGEFEYKDGRGGVYVTDTISPTWNDRISPVYSKDGQGKPVYHFMAIMEGAENYKYGTLGKFDDSWKNWKFAERVNTEFDPDALADKTIPALRSLFSQPKPANAAELCKKALNESILISHAFIWVPYDYRGEGLPKGWIEDLNGKPNNSGRQQLFKGNAAHYANVLGNAFGKRELWNHNGRGVDDKIPTGSGGGMTLSSSEAIIYAGRNKTGKGYAIIGPKGYSL